MIRLFISFVFLIQTLSIAAPKEVRWTYAEDDNPELSHVLDKLSEKTGISLSLTDFTLIEDRPLATSHFTMLVQTAAKIPVRGQTLRIWTSRKTGKSIQIEARVDNPPNMTTNRVMSLTNRTSDPDGFVSIARNLVKQSEDHQITGVSFQDYWENGELTRSFKIRGKHGNHEVVISLSSDRKSVV